MSYIPPTTQDLENLKNELGFTGIQMATLSKLAGGHQWRKYTGGHSPRNMGFHMLFFIAAKLELSEIEINKIFERMKKIGAQI